MSIPEDVFQAIEKKAQEQGATRSALYTRALRRMLKEDRDRQIREQLDAVYADYNPEEDENREFLHEAARRMFERNPW